MPEVPFIDMVQRSFEVPAFRFSQGLGFHLAHDAPERLHVRVLPEVSHLGPTEICNCRKEPRNRKPRASPACVVRKSLGCNLLM